MLGGLGVEGFYLGFEIFQITNSKNEPKPFFMAGSMIAKGSLVNALKQAWEWNDWIEEGQIGSIEELVEKVKVSRRYVERVLNMRYLSPKIQLMILRGNQPPSWTTHTFNRAVPPDWKEQEERFYV